MAAWALGDPQRLSALAESDLFPGVPEHSLDPFAKIVARLLRVPVALVSIVTDDRQFFPAQVGLGEPWATRGETPLTMSFCQHVVAGNAPLVIPDATGDERVAGNLAIEELDVIAYLGVPLLAPGGEPLGALCAIDDHPRHWTDDDLTVLQEVADAVAQTLALRTGEHRWARFANEASHRLGTPMTALRLELEDLASWPALEDDARAAIGNASRQATELSGIVDGLASLARARDRLGVEEVDVAAVVAEVLVADGMAARVDVDGPAVITTAPPVLRHVVALLVAALGAQGSSVRAAIVPAEAHLRVQLVVVGGASGDAPDLPASLRDEIYQRLGGRVASYPAPAVGYELLLPLAR